MEHESLAASNFDRRPPEAYGRHRLHSALKAQPSASLRVSRWLPSRARFPRIRFRCRPSYPPATSNTQVEHPSPEPKLAPQGLCGFQKEAQVIVMRELPVG